MKIFKPGFGENKETSGKFDTENRTSWFFKPPDSLVFFFPFSIPIFCNSARLFKDLSSTQHFPQRPPNESNPTIEREPFFFEEQEVSLLKIKSPKLLENTND